MPIYCFECTKCSHKETILMKIAEHTNYGHMCPVCEDMELTRDMTAEAGSLHTFKCGTTSTLDYHRIKNHITGK